MKRMTVGCFTGTVKRNMLPSMSCSLLRTHVNVFPSKTLSQKEVCLTYYPSLTMRPTWDNSDTGSSGFDTIGIMVRRKQLLLRYKGHSNWHYALVISGCLQ